MRHQLVGLATLALLCGSGSAVAAQEEAEPPPAGAFTPAGSLTLARTGHTATLLPDGRVLITGGEGVGPEDLSTAEVWDPASATFGPADELVEPRPEPLVEAELDRADHTATLLPDGRALVVGGTAAGAPIAEAVLHAPETELTVPAGALAEPRSGHTATFLRDGRVLVVGGTGADGAVASAELWTSARKPAKCLGKRPTLIAQPGMELVGSKGDDVIAGSVGDDLVRGGGGNDRICGYGGADTLDGGGGNDTIDGGPGADKITGAAGKDRLTGAAGDDTLNGGKGADVCVGGKGIDWLPSCNEKRATRGTVTVTRNTKLKGPHKGRFIIGRDRVTLDCDGHTITGAGRKVEDIHAITLLRRKGVTVRNCDIRDHGRGFQVERSNRNTLTHNRMSRVGNGIVLSRSDRNRLLANRVTDTDVSGYVLMFGSDRNRLRDNVVTEAGHQGFSIWFSDRNEISDNIVTDSTIGFLVGESDAEGRVAERNVFSRNSAIDNADWGFEDRTTGFKGDAGTDNHYRDNTCTGDAGGGKSSPATLCEPATVPAMVGLGAEAAGRALRQAGLAGAPREVFSETVPAGVVVSQALAPGTAVDKGRSIVYTVSVGPDVGAEGNDPEA